MPTQLNPLSNSANARPPVILAFGALDPAGGSGIQADIETAASLGCHCAPIATALCTTGTSETHATLAVESPLLIEQARSVLGDMPVAAIKLGFMGSVANIEAVHSILRDYPHIPVVAHPALNLWDPEDLNQAGLLDALDELLLPEATIVNLTLAELRELAPEADTLDASAQAIINHGCDYVLVCGTAQEKDRSQNSLYRSQGLIKRYQWKHTAPQCQSSAGTLSASIAAYLAHNSSPIAAVEQGQNYTWQSLMAARQLGSGNAIPHRFFWADPNLTTSDAPPAQKSTH